MLTIEKLKAMKPHTIFAKGEFIDVKDGINISGIKRKMRWIAVRGDVHDWAVYCSLANINWEGVIRWGDKINTKSYIKKLVPCDDEALEMYRR